MKVLFILVVLAIIPQIAAAGLFDILDEQYISDISQLPYSGGLPDNNIQEQGNIRGWIDIVGFRNLSKEGDKYFILGDPASSAIVQSNAQGMQPGYQDSITKDLSFSQSGSDLIAVMNVKLRWHTTQCDKDRCWNIYHDETAAFQDIEQIPEQYNKVLNPAVNITEYNNDIEPKISIQITNASGISLKYGNKSLTHSSKSYHVEQTAKGIFYANISDLEAWDIQGQGIARLGNLIIINTNLSAFNSSQLDIRVSNLYGSVRVDPSQFNINQVKYNPETVLNNPVLFAFIGVIVVLTGAGYYLIKRGSLWIL